MAKPTKRVKTSSRAAQATAKPKAAAPATKPVKQTSPVMAGKLKDAAKKGDVGTVSALLERGIDPNLLVKDSSVLATAVYWGHEAVVKLLLEHGADPNIGKSYPSAGGAMHAAASQGKVEMLSMLLQHGGDPNARGQHDGRPLSTAIGHVKPPPSGAFGAKHPGRKAMIAMIRALIVAGARPHVEELVAAIRIGDREVFDLIAAVDPERVVAERKKVLDEVAARDFKMIDAVIAHGVPVLDALHKATLFDRASVVESLLAQGADPRAKLDGKTALEVAVEHRASKAMRVLQS